MLEQSGAAESPGRTAAESPLHIRVAGGVAGRVSVHLAFDNTLHLIGLLHQGLRAIRDKRGRFAPFAPESAGDNGIQKVGTCYSAVENCHILKAQFWPVTNVFSG
eukprot:CAMPEP_0185392846 /NCGR_PEP_ID=MMETSP1364-20130426/77309_1 /TAXON_ID=38817 /ORGANISM="Gephyrocapsa oceanica, Strain RCC1303" /LENGTH=104 /DNA_ID=CAMNT_0027994901 /DNA_START=289 /DNA_END=600 /DNA_ORIENTATION=-